MYQLTFCTEAWYNFYSIKMFAKAPINFPQICVKWFLHACHFSLLHGELSTLHSSIALFQPAASLVLASFLNY